MKRHNRKHTNIISNELHTIVFLYNSFEYRYIDNMSSMEINYNYSNKDKNTININFADTSETLEDFMEISVIIVDLQDFTGKAVKRKSFKVKAINYNQTFVDNEKDEASIINILFNIISGDISSGDLAPIENYIRDFKINGLIE